MGLGYKLFRMKEGKLYPLYVFHKEETPMGVWLEAKRGEMVDDKHVKSKSGKLAYRPGWHLCDEAPYETHIGKKGSDGKIAYLPHDLVWCEVEYSDRISYQITANEMGRNDKGKIIAKNACLNFIPRNGCYRYKTNPNMYGTWIIAGTIKVNRILDDEEVYRLCKAKGLEPLPREVINKEAM